jgi:hypothetical protein
MAKTVRRYSAQTIRVLWGLAGNHCGFPDCPNKIIVKGKVTPAKAVGHISHIYSASDKGPRANPGLTAKQRNAPENLIILCRHHHGIVDDFEEEYPAETLLEWKRIQEARLIEGTPENFSWKNDTAKFSFFRTASDQKIETELARIRKGRAFPGFPTIEATRQLAGQVENGDWSGGTAPTRSMALAWCARALAQEDPVRSKTLIDLSKSLGAVASTAIAEAILNYASDPSGALSRLSALGTSDAKSAALRLVLRAKGFEGAVAWWVRAGIQFDEFSGDGKQSVLTALLRTSKWNDATLHGASLNEEDFSEAPVLLYLAAFTHLIQAVAEDLRSYVVTQVPVESDDFPLSSDPAGLAQRRRAIELFDRAAKAWTDLGASDSADNMASDYALWLRLLDADTRAKALLELKESLEGPTLPLRRVNLGLRAGLHLNLRAIQEEIDRRVAFDGVGTADTAAVRVTLILATKSPSEAVAWIAKYRTELYGHLNKTYLQQLEITLLAHSGDFNTAKGRLADFVEDGLTAPEYRRLEQIIEQSAGTDPGRHARQAFEESGSTSDLINLVWTLGEQRNWKDQCLFARKLFARTHDLNAAVMLANALDQNQQLKALLEFLRSIPELVSNNAGLKERLAWTLYRSGCFTEAFEELRSLLSIRDSQNDRKLALHLAIASGRWEDLIELTNAEWDKRAARSPQELLLAGQLAQYIGAPHGKDLIREAARQSEKDSNILMGAYLGAVGGGWERDEEVANWLETSIRRSGRKGPIRKMSLKRAVALQPDWNKREEAAWQSLNAGSAPAFVAGDVLNRSLLDLHLKAAIANAEEQDARRRSMIYAFSGARQYVSAEKRPRKVALDVTALFTLFHVGLLKAAFDHYERVIVPHSTLAWLLEEHQSSAFHQPSVIKEAKLLDHLVSSGKLTVLKSTSVEDRSLQSEVGSVLAELIEAAKSARRGEKLRRYVVRGYPVHRSGSLTNAKANLKAYANRICSSHSVARALRRKGRLTKKQLESALLLLSSREKMWPKERDIKADTVEFYLDPLAIAHLQSASLMDKLGGARFKFFIHESSLAAARQLISAESVGAQQLVAIGEIRKTLRDGFERGKVQAASEREVSRGGADANHPTISILDVDDDIEAFVVDDRFINRHQTMDQPSRKVPILTTINVIDDLAARGVLGNDDRYAALTKLRQCGYHFVPVTEVELIHHINHADSREFVETAELQAIRESILRSRMAKGLQVPLELPWLQSTANALINTMKQLWFGRGSKSRAEIYSAWLLRLVDLRGWAPSAAEGNERNFAVLGYASQLLQLTSQIVGIPPTKLKSYNEWLERHVLAGFKENDPEAFAWLCKRAADIAKGAADFSVRDLK